MFKYFIFIFIFLAFLPAISSAEDIFELVTKNEQINGCWERINFSPQVMKKMNKVESFPWEYQVYCFNDEGKLWSMCSNRDLSEKLDENIRLMKIFPGMEYSFPVPGVMLVSDKEAMQDIYWVVRKYSQDRIIAGVHIKKGDVLMNLRERPDGPDIYYRFLRKVGDF